MCQEKGRQVIAVAEKEEGELWPCATRGKVLPIAVWWLLQGSITSQEPKGQRWSAWLLAGSLGTWWSAESVVSPCQQKKSSRESSWSTCQLLQRLEPRDCVWWGVQRGCCPAKCEHQCPFGVSSKAFRSFVREKTHPPCPLGCKAFLVSHTCRADCNCGIFSLMVWVHWCKGWKDPCEWNLPCMHQLLVFADRHIWGKPAWIVIYKLLTACSAFCFMLLDSFVYISLWLLPTHLWQIWSP